MSVSVQCSDVSINTVMVCFLFLILFPDTSDVISTVKLLDLCLVALDSGCESVMSTIDQINDLMPKKQMMKNS